MENSDHEQVLINPLSRGPHNQPIVNSMIDLPYNNAKVFDRAQNFESRNRGLANALETRQLEAEFALAYFPKATQAQKMSVIDIACGSGDHAEYLAKQGYDVTGIEYAPKMASTANDKLSPLGGRVINGDMKKIKEYLQPLREIHGKPEVMTIFGESYIYLNPREQMDFLKDCYEELPKGGRLIMQFRCNDGKSKVEPSTKPTIEHPNNFLPGHEEIIQNIYSQSGKKRGELTYCIYDRATDEVLYYLKGDEDQEPSVDPRFPIEQIPNAPERVSTVATHLVYFKKSSDQVPSIMPTGAMYAYLQIGSAKDLHSDQYFDEMLKISGFNRVERVAKPYKEETSQTEMGLIIAYKD